MRGQLLRPLALASLATVALIACGGKGDGSSPTTSSENGDGIPAIDWQKCSYDDRLHCGTLDVPYDYDDPELGSFSLALVRNPADDQGRRIGTLLVNPGGPGFGGTVMAENADFIYGQELLDRFDIVGWDPRGTGKSEPAIDCIDSFDDYFTADPTPSDDQQQEDLETASREFVDACEERSGEILPYVSTNASVRDIDAIRRALGEETISYFGFSYGSELGAAWATAYPDTVRAAVLDGAVDPTLDGIEAGIQQALGFERELTTFLAQCSDDPECAFHNDGDAEGAYDSLMERIDRLPLFVSADRTRVTTGVAVVGVITALYSSDSWPELAAALAAAQENNGRPLLDLWDTYYQSLGNGEYGNEIEAFYAISCIDDSFPRTVADTDAFNDEFLATAPRLGAGFIGQYQCAFWPAPTDERIAIRDNGANVLVVGTTGDSATPIEGTRVMATALGAPLLTVEANQHTAYSSMPCAGLKIDEFLVGLRPSDDLYCRS